MRMTENGNGKPNPFEGWTTIEEAAEIVGRDNSTVRSWADRGLITCYAVGRKVRVVEVAEVKRYSDKITRRKPKQKSRESVDKISETA
jgi:excisionase family DNA binding protein